MKFASGRFVLLGVLTAFGTVPAFAQQTLDAPPALTPQQEQRIKEVKQANADFFHALEEKDIVAFDERVADDAILCGSGRLQMTSKLAFEKLMQTPTFKPMAVTIKESAVQFQNQTVIVLNDIFVQDISASQIPKEHLYVMNVFVKRDARWQLLASYSSSEGKPSPPVEPVTK